MSFYSGSAMPTPERVTFHGVPIAFGDGCPRNLSYYLINYGLLIDARKTWLTRSHQNKYYRHRKGIRR